eukprot:jgi/Mesvir1/25509/Mv01759-RA.5
MPLSCSMTWHGPVPGPHPAAFLYLCTLSTVLPAVPSPLASPVRIAALCALLPCAHCCHRAGKKGKGPTKASAGGKQPASPRTSPGHSRAVAPPSEEPAASQPVAPTAIASTPPIAIPAPTKAAPPSYQDVMREKAEELLSGASPGGSHVRSSEAPQAKPAGVADGHKSAPMDVGAPMGEPIPFPAPSKSVGATSPSMGATLPPTSPSTAPLDGSGRPVPQLQKRDSFKQRLGEEWEAAKKKLLPGDSPPTGKVNIDKARDKAISMDLKALADAQISEILQHRQTIEEQNNELATRKAKLDATREEMNGLHAQLKGKDASIAALEAAVQAAHAEHSRALREAERARNEAKQLKEDAAELPKLKNDSARRAAEIEALTAKLSTQEFEARHARLELARAREELGTLRAAAGHSADGHDNGSSGDSLSEEMRKAFARQEAEIQRLSAELEAAAQQASKAVTGASAAPGPAGLKLLQELQTKVAELEAEREVSSLRSKRLEKELKDKEKEVAFVRDRDAREMKTMSEEVVRQKKEINELKGKLAAPDWSRLDIGPQPDAHRSAAATESEQERQLVTLRREIASLSEAHAAAVRSLTMERDGLAAKSNQLRDEVSMMTAQMKRRASAGSMSSPTDANRGPQREELDRLRARVAGLEKELQDANARKTRAASDVGAKERLQKEAKDARDAAEAAQREVAELRKAAAAAAAGGPKRMSNAGVVERWEKEAEELRTRLVPLEKEVLKLRLENARLLEALDEAGQGRSADGPKESAASVAALQRELKKLRGWLEARDDELAQVAKRASGEKEEIARLTAELRKVKGEAAVTEEGADRARRQLASNKEEIAKLKSLLAKRSDELVEVEQAAKKNKDEVAALQEQLRKAKLRSSSFSSEHSAGSAVPPLVDHRAEVARLADVAEKRRVEAEAVKAEAELVKKEMAALRAALEEAARVSKQAQSDMQALRGKLAEQDATLASFKKRAESELVSATAAASSATAEVRRLQAEVEHQKTLAATKPATATATAPAPHPALPSPSPSSDAVSQTVMSPTATSQLEKVLEGYMEANARLGKQLQQQSGMIAQLESRLAHAHAQLQEARGDAGDAMSEPGVVAVAGAADIDSTSLALAVALDPAGTPIKSRPSAASSTPAATTMTHQVTHPAPEGLLTTPTLPTARTLPTGGAPDASATGVADATASTGKASVASRLADGDLESLASVVAEAVRVSKALNSVSIAESRASREVAARKELRAALAAERKAREEAVRAEHAARAEVAALHKELRRVSRTLAKEATTMTDNNAGTGSTQQYQLTVRGVGMATGTGAASVDGTASMLTDGDVSEAGRCGAASVLGSDAGGAYGASAFGGVPASDASGFDVLENPLWDTSLLDASMLSRSEAGGGVGDSHGLGVDEFHHGGDGGGYARGRGRPPGGPSALTTWQYIPAYGWSESPLLAPRGGGGDGDVEGPSWLDLNGADASSIAGVGATRSERGWAGVGGGGGANLMVLSEVVAEHMLQRWRDLDESLWELGSTVVTTAASNAGEGVEEGGSRRGRTSLGQRPNASPAIAGQQAQGDGSMSVSRTSLDVLGGVSGSTGGFGGGGGAPPLGLEVEAIEVLRAQLLRSMEADCAKLEAVMKAERHASELVAGASGQLYGGGIEAAVAAGGSGRGGGDNKGPSAVSAMLALVKYVYRLLTSIAASLCGAETCPDRLPKHSSENAQTSSTQLAHDWHTIGTRDWQSGLANGTGSRDWLTGLATQDYHIWHTGGQFLRSPCGFCCFPDRVARNLHRLNSCSSCSVARLCVCARKLSRHALRGGWGARVK